MYGLLMIDIEGTTLTNEDIDLIQQDEVGGLILFSRNVNNPDQVRKLCDHIRNIKANILIAVDQEGGRVTRLKKGFTPLPAMGKLGELFSKDPCHALKLSYKCGYLMASEVLSVGIDLSFAPVLDLNGISQVIGDRSFHTNPEAVIALSSQFMLGMKKAGMATTGKHFPGHGSVAPDSHIDDAIDNRPLDEIINHDMQTFIKTMPWLDALMPAHIIFSEIDSKPAGFSEKWIKEIIRTQLKFDGVLFSDDLSMKAAHVAGDIGKRIMAATSAGCDIALVCNDRDSSIKALQIAKSLPRPNQERIKKMKGNIPEWRGSLEDTCSKFPDWLDSKISITKFI